VLALLLLFPDRPLDEGRLAGLTSEGLERADAHVATTIARIDGARMASDDAALVADELRLAAGLQRHATRLGRARLAVAGHRLEQVPAAERRALADDLGRLIGDYRRIWLARNRPGGLSDSVGRLEALSARY
jgi:hypothetical protein